MHSAQPLSFDSLHEASHVVLGAYVGATDIHVVLDYGKPRCNFRHFQAMPGLVMSYAGYAGDRLLSKLPESDCVRRSTSDHEIRRWILEKLANPIGEASVCAEAKRLALELVQRFTNEIGEAATSIQLAMWQRRSIPADEIEQLDCVIRVRALGVVEGEIDAKRKTKNT
jgi:hypothetical protein